MSLRKEGGVGLRGQTVFQEKQPKESKGLNKVWSDQHSHGAPVAVCMPMNRAVYSHSHHPHGTVGLRQERQMWRHQLAWTLKEWPWEKQTPDRVNLRMSSSSPTKRRPTLVESCLSTGKTDEIFKSFCKNNPARHNAEKVSMKWKLLSCFQISQRNTH
uniref:Testis cDNA, clone: QtsA-16321 n=1 Tax=Macaca fascicularis TaxID=9541 RepID=A5LFX4_MACFA|nr:unnamed protein product [Macaca fascicularis]